MTEQNKQDLANHLGVEVNEPVEKTVTAVAPNGTKIEVTEISVSVKISPRGTYSSAETAMTVSLTGATAEQKEGVKSQLKQEVIAYTIDTAEKAMAAANQKGMI